MNPITPYLITLWGHRLLHIGCFTSPELNATIFEPFDLEDCEILMTETDGPLVAINSKVWPVRAYDVAFSLDKLLLNPRYRENENALHLYPFERNLLQGGAKQKPGDPDTFLKRKKGTPEVVKRTVVKSLLDRVELLPTDTKTELRLLKPMKLALLTLAQPEPLPFR